MPGARRAVRRAGRHRRGHGGHPLHVREHWKAQGSGAFPPQPPRRRRERERVPAEQGGRLHPRRSPAQLRRRLQPADHRVLGRGPRGARELPAARRRGPPLCAAPRDGAHLRPAALDPARRSGLAARGERRAALFRQHGRAHAQVDAAEAPRDLSQRPAVPHVRPDGGLPLHLPRPFRGGQPARLDRQGDPQRGDPRRTPRRDALRPGRAGRARSSRSARGPGLLERPGAHSRALQARARPRVRTGRLGARRVVG